MGGGAAYAVAMEPALRFDLRDERGVDAFWALIKTASMTTIDTARFAGANLAAAAAAPWGGEEGASASIIIGRGAGGGGGGGGGGAEAEEEEEGAKEGGAEESSAASMLLMGGEKVNGRLPAPISAARGLGAYLAHLGGVPRLKPSLLVAAPEMGKTRAWCQESKDFKVA